MLSLKSEVIGKPYTMPDTIVIYKYCFSGQWTRSDAADVINKPQYPKNQSIYKFQPLAQKKLTLYSFSREIKVLGTCVDREYFWTLEAEHIFIPR